MAEDWRDKLMGMAGALPAGDDTADIPVQAPAPRQGRLDIVTERKGRGGKVATIICGLTISDEAAQELAATLKRRLGTGGSARGGEILIQGDRAADVLEALTRLGYKARII